VQHDPGVGGGHAHARFTGSEQEAAHRGGLTDANRADTRTDILHRVVDRHAGGYHATRRVDVKIYVLLRIFRLQEQQLRRDD